MAVLAVRHALWKWGWVMTWNGRSEGARRGSLDGALYGHLEDAMVTLAWSCVLELSLVPQYLVGYLNHVFSVTRWLEGAFRAFRIGRWPVRREVESQLRVPGRLRRGSAGRGVPALPAGEGTRQGREGRSVGSLESGHRRRQRWKRGAKTVGRSVKSVGHPGAPYGSSDRLPAEFRLRGA